ncbi:MAG TPA: hypothetical protein VJQ77_04425 [Novosphingobium sp.]|nr:hypothetical protein [Novosphingobium sp.]
MPGTTAGIRLKGWRVLSHPNTAIIEDVRPIRQLLEVPRKSEIVATSPCRDDRDYPRSAARTIYAIQVRRKLVTSHAVEPKESRF